MEFGRHVKSLLQSFVAFIPTHILKSREVCMLVITLQIIISWDILY
jgi:hypothetical protein